MEATLRNDDSSNATMKRWVVEFKHDRQSLDDDAPAGRPVAVELQKWSIESMVLLWMTGARVKEIYSQYILIFTGKSIPGRVVQSVTCLATDACLTADPWVASSILALSHTSVEIDHEIISTVILLPSPESFKKGCCQ